MIVLLSFDPSTMLRAGLAQDKQKRLKIIIVVLWPHVKAEDRIQKMEDRM